MVTGGPEDRVAEDESSPPCDSNTVSRFFERFANIDVKIARHEKRQKLEILQQGILPVKKLNKELN